MLEWTVKAVLAPYNVDYYNFPVELNTASRRFTVRGWNTFAQSFISQGNFDELKRARLLCHAQSQRAAVIHQTSYVQGALAYQIQFPITQTCENVNQTSSNNLLVTALVIRTNDDDHPDGLAVDQLVASPHGAGGRNGVGSTIVAGTAVKARRAQAGWRRARWPSRWCRRGAAQAPAPGEPPGPSASPAGGSDNLRMATPPRHKKPSMTRSRCRPN